MPKKKKKKESKDSKPIIIETIQKYIYMTTQNINKKEG